MNTETNNPNSNSWEQDQNRIKTLWVVCVLAFWGSAIFQVVLYFLQGQVNIILISVIIGMMILGVALKIRLQRHLRAKPDDLE